jgi:DNA (cytosine-5)-methyltransferase 1
MAPRVCFFENVEGHITLGLREVIAELEELGYQTAWGIFSAAEVGAPHQRKRVFILAHRKGERLEGYNGLLAGCGESGWVAQGPQGQACGSNHGRNVWPSRPGQAQHAWEPPRVVGNAESREDNGRESGDMGRTTSERRCGNDAADSAGEGVGESTCELPHGSGTSSEEAGCSKLADSSEREIELTLGRSIARTPGGLDYAELCVSCDNRTDELRLLGNGVVPATAEKAFRTLINEIQKTATTTSQLG